MHSPSNIIMKNAASCTVGQWLAERALHIPIQRQHAHKIATSVYDICIRDRYSRKLRLASESAEEEETRLSRRDRARRAALQATENCRGSETAEARECRDRDRRKRRLHSESAEEKETRLSSKTLSK